MKSLLLVVIISASSFAWFGGPAAYESADCGVGCATCGRTLSATHLTQCNISVIWAPFADTDGCCPPPPVTCTARDCVWNGDLRVKNTAAGAVRIDIGGPGAVKTCLVVAPNGTCVKTFGGGGNPTISEACGGDDTVYIDVDSGSTCQATVTFICAACVS